MRSLSESGGGDDEGEDEYNDFTHDAFLLRVESKKTSSFCGSGPWKRFIGFSIGRNLDPDNPQKNVPFGS